MEDFIADIYRYSFIISNFKEFISLINSGCTSIARKLYNKTAAELEQWLENISITDPLLASSVQDIAVDIKDHYSDHCYIKGRIEYDLIPALYTCMKDYNNIDVIAGNYTLKSSKSGFITAIDNRTGMYLHDINDPMNEALQISEVIYSPQMEHFHILGCGLGYLPYQIYRQSEGAVKIHIYEDDASVLDYAALYGVISLIPDELIDIIHNIDREQVAKRFISDCSTLPSSGFYISSFKKSAYNGICGNEINRMIINHDFDLETRRLSAVNLWKNRKIDRIAFSELPNLYHYDEWVIISAGPSLDYNISFLKKNKGQNGLIAVNTVLRRLLKEEIIPDIIVAADQFHGLFDHISGIETATKGILLIADWLLNWKYASSFLGQICFVRTNASARITQHFLSEESIWDISGTVASLAVEAAVHLGAKKVYLVGQDLSYPSGQKYAAGMPHLETPNAQWDMQVPSVDGGMVDTCEAFDWFRKALEYQISKYNDTEFINLSKHGAMIKGSSVNYFS